MRPIAELLAFLQQDMTMQRAYQPLIILHLLCHGGCGTRGEIARSLAAGEMAAVAEWDRILMKNPKPVLVETHQILRYDKPTGTFRLNFDLSDGEAVAAAVAICEEKVWEWVRRSVQQGRIEEAEALQVQGAMLWAKGGEVASGETDPELDLFAVERVGQALRQRYSGEPIQQQAYGTPGFDWLVGPVVEPVAYVKVGATYGQQAGVTLREVDRRFSVEQGDCYGLAIVYGVNLSTQDYQLAWHWGPIGPGTAHITPMTWRIQVPSPSPCDP